MSYSFIAYHRFGVKQKMYENLYIGTKLLSSHWQVSTVYIYKTFQNIRGSHCMLEIDILRNYSKRFVLRDDF